MTLFEAIIMGIIQGIAEFLPISSSGHLAIFRLLFGIEIETGLLFDVLLHLGTLAAIFVVYWKDIKELIIEGFKIVGRAIKNTYIGIKNVFSKEKESYVKVVSTPYERFVMMVIVSTIPTGIIGVLFKDVIEYAGTTLIIPGIFLIITGILLVIADRVKPGTKNESTASYKDAGMIGLAQGIATVPGLSRSGTTIAACLMNGFDKTFAVKYSFIMSIPAVLGAVVLELKDFTSISIPNTELLYYGIGTVISGVVGYICIKTMLVIIRGKKFKYFSYYCFAMGLIAIIGNFFIG